MIWYHRIIDDISLLPDFIQYFENELVVARQELNMSGRSLERHASELPGIVENRYSQLQEIEAVLEYFNIMLRSDRSKHFKKYLEGYNRALTSRDAEKYIDGEDSVVNTSILINEIALLRNQYLGITKSLETKNFMMSNVVKLRVAGLDDAHL